MNNTKLLEQLNNIIKSLPEDERKQADYFMQNNDRNAAGLLDRNIPAIVTDLIKDVTDLIKDVTEDLHRAEAKAFGKGAAQKAAERIIKQATDRKMSAGAYTLDGLQYIGGCFSVVRLSEPLPVTELPKDKEPINYQQIIELASKNEGDTLQLPHRNYLPVYIKTEKARHKSEKGFVCKWDFGDNLPAVDAALLLDMLNLLGNCTAVLSYRNPQINAIYFKNDKGEDGILMPVRK